MIPCSTFLIYSTCLNSMVVLKTFLFTLLLLITFLGPMVTQCMYLMIICSNKSKHTHTHTNLFAIQFSEILTMWRLAVNWLIHTRPFSPLSPEKCVTDHTGMEGLLGQETKVWQPRHFLVNNLVESWTVWDGRHPNWSLYICVYYIIIYVCVLYNYISINIYVICIHRIYLFIKYREDIDIEYTSRERGEERI